MRYDDAFRYAHDLHREQTRKGTSIAYISHLMTVSALVIEHGGNEVKSSVRCCMTQPKIKAGRKH